MIVVRKPLDQSCQRMQLLLSLTNATPETRLVLITWAVLLGKNFQAGSREVLATALGVSKRNLGIALEYLEQEGYLWKIKSPLERQEGDKSKVRFDYALSTECWEMWSALFDSCVWQNELISVLAKTSLVDSDSTGKPIRLSTNSRLVWAALVMRSNTSRYVLGSDDVLICRLTGITQVNLLRAAKDLAVKGVISIAANNVKKDKLHPYLPPIYKLQRQDPGTKIIKLGVTLSRNSLLPLRCISKLVSYYQRACKLSEGRYPIQDTPLSNEQLFKLSTFFVDKDLRGWIHQLYLSSIFSFLPISVSTVREEHQSGQEACNSILYQLRCRLSDALFSSQSIFPLADILTQDKPSSVDEIEILKSYLLDIVSQETWSAVQELTDSWRLFNECIGKDARIVDHKYREQMLSISNPRTVAEDEVPNDSNDETHKTTLDMNWSASCVLYVMVPDTNSYADCMVLGDQLLTSSMDVKHQKVHHVQQLICGNAYPKLEIHSRINK